MNDRLTGNHYQMFGPDLKQPNSVICFQATGARRPFSALATDNLVDLHLFFDGTQCLPLYRYTEDGERVSNITEWGLVADQRALPQGVGQGLRGGVPKRHHRRAYLRLHLRRPP